MAKTQYLEYTIHLISKAEAAAKQLQFPDGVRKAPAVAAVDYTAPIQIVSAPFVAPCTRSPFFTFPVLLPSTLTNYPRHLATFTRKSGGWFGLSFLFGTTTTFIWVGKFAYAPDPTAVVDGEPTEIVAIAKRKFMAGWESLNHSAGNADNTSVGGSSSGGMVEASRHLDGMGWYASEGNGNSAVFSQFGATASNKTWERLYFKLVTAPQAANERIWYGTGGGLSGVSLNMTPDRRIAVHNVDAGGNEVVLASSSTQFELGRWYRMDWLVEFKNPGGNIRVWFNRAIEINVIAPAGVGLSLTMNHTQSHIGAGGIHVAADQFQCYYDDWVGAEWPTEDSQGRFVGLDWLNGSRVIAVPVTGFGTGNNWLGDYRYANHFRVPATIPGSTGLTSSVSGDALRLVADTRALANTPGSLGAVQFMVAVYGVQTVAGQGTLGWKYDGVIDLASQVTNVGGAAEGGGGNAWFRRWFQPSGLTEPIANLDPFELHKVKASNANAATILAAVILVELIGAFGDEDVAEDEDDVPTAIPARRGIHNSPYPDTPWARSTIPPISPVITHTGTYVGNDTVTQLTFRAPVGWLWIRPVLGAGEIGSLWFSSMVQGHIRGGQGASMALPVQAMIDPTFVPVDAEDEQEQRTVIQVSGNDQSTNQNTVVYQYVAFMDPGSRYHLNGAYSNRNNAFPAPTGKVTPLAHPTFLPEYGFVQQESTGSGGSTFSRHAKGPGHAADAASKMDSAETAAALTFAAGQITTRALVQGTTNEITWAYSLWRDDDLSSDPNKHNVVRVFSYTGDGSATRSVSFGTSGKRPVFAIITPHNATSYYRDPSHLTNNSNAMNGAAISTTAITGGGIDTIIVGSALNANGVIYEVFVLIGSATGGNGGWSIDGEFSVVEPDSPEDGDYTDGDDSDEDEDPDPVDPDPDPGPDDGDDCNDGVVCVAATTRIVNLALLEIGSVQVLTNYCTQQTKEARIAQEVYEQCVRHTLITYPWPFATKYAVLALTAAQPSNQDWVYAYRMPVDCIFPRRIVVNRGTAVDPSPPPMGLSSDGSGGIILSNEQNATLEYTARPGCVGFNGDDLFREALKWRLAAALAPPLTRIPGEADRCLKMFEIIVQKAESVVKQGVPGLRPSASALDTTQAALDANIQVVNMALVKIGSRTIRNLSSEQSREAVASALVFEDTLRSVLRDHPWAFATRYVDPLTLVDGAEGDPATPDWTYSHRLPTDLVYLRRVVLEGTGRSFDPEPFPFRLASDTTGGLLYSNQAEPIIEYTARLQNILTYGDALFREALSWKLAATLAPSLASVELHRPEQHGRGPETPQDPTRRTAQRFTDQSRRINISQWANAMYQRALLAAAAADRNEAQPEPDGLPDWLRARS